MKIDRNSFFQIYETKFWQKLKESIVPFDDNPKKDEFLAELYEEVTTFTYNPKHPREYIVVNKHNGISRYVPTFSRKDYCVYYLCIKLLEAEIAVNRVDGTFGGWTLGNPIRLKEEQEILELDYIPFNTFNELAWVEEWQTFQNIALKYRDLDDWHCFICLDVANFYDCINLAILERKIRHVVPKSKQEVVTLLFHLLRHWNKKLEGYNIKTVGIPQDEIGDCSRILANFYLQDFDFEMKRICDSHDAKFIRFADDQIIYAKTMEDAKKILFEASKELLRINLNFNSSKVKEFKTKHEFNEYWAFDTFDLLKDKNDKTKINKGIKKYFGNLDKGINFREDSILKRVLTIDSSLIEPKFRHRLLSMFYEEDFLAQLKVWHLQRVRKYVNNDAEFFQILDDLIDFVPFNSFHYNLLAFYKKERKGYNLDKLIKRIESIRLK